MESARKTARVAGVLYVLVMLTGAFVLLYVPSKLFVPGDSAATAANILSQQSLFRACIVVGLISEALFIALAFALYRLLAEVNRTHATLMVVLVLAGAPLALLSTANDVATLAFLEDARVLTAFDKPQRDAIAMLFFNADRFGAALTQILWGLWLLPLGMLVIRSGFLPRILGGWLLVNGIGYVAMSLTSVLTPENVAFVSKIATPALLGEVAFGLWLLVMGAGERSAAPQALAPG